MKNPISQREARRLRKRVAEFEQDNSVRMQSWKINYPGGVYIVGIIPSLENTKGRLDAAKMLGCVLVARWRNGETLDVFAIAPKN